MPSRASVLRHRQGLPHVVGEATMVTSVPARFTSATPSGTRWSPSGTGPVTVASRLHSKETTGLLSRMALLRRPLASAGVEGRMIFRPGEMHPHRVRALRMLGGEANAAPGGASVGHGKIGLAAKHVADLARLIDDLIHGHEGERHHPPVHDGAEARARRAQAHARQHRFGDGREAHARRTELLDGVAREIGGERG
mgnify:CR=1 FL=1